MAVTKPCLTSMFNKSTRLKEVQVATQGSPDIGAQFGYGTDTDHRH